MSSAKRAVELAQQRAQRAHKQEALGRLAGNVAHDFNNIFTAMLGYLTLIERRWGDQAAAEVAELEDAVHSACRLSHQLMMVAGRRDTAPSEIELLPLLERLGRGLAERLPAGITVRVAGEPGARVRADASQLEQVVSAVTTNAAEAMSDLGAITLAVEECDAEYLPLGALRAQEYVVLRVADTGAGMDQAQLARVFEPFFTTKEPRAGRGFGLPVAYAAVRRAGGDLILESRLGEGTTCRVVLPRLVW